MDGHVSNKEIKVVEDIAATMSEHGSNQLKKRREKMFDNHYDRKHNHSNRVRILEPNAINSKPNQKLVAATAMNFYLVLVLFCCDSLPL